MADIPKTYEPEKYEDETYKLWEQSGFFNPDNLKLKKNAKPYTIIFPPPNITDKLHLGHSAMLAIEDLLIRFHRMNGYRTLWLPGTDHAAIATQNAVEKKLLKETGKSRHELGKVKFLEEVWKFIKVTQAIILTQTRKMGASLDWSRKAFTLDEPRKEAVKKMFVDMYAAGLIYQGLRIVNWCPRCHSTLADDEVEHKKQTAKLYTFKYDKNFPIAIATTRPETKLGDTAVAVNPKDGRYKNFTGKTFEANFAGVPLKIKIISSREVDMHFGTGALGVTPAHSAIDWKMAEENGLPVIKVINEEGRISPGFADFSGKTVIETRNAIIKKLKDDKLLASEIDMENSLSVCYRCGTAIEPIPSKQWFVAVDKKIKKLGNKSLKEKALEAAVKKKIRFIPIRFKKRYIDWMTNLHDWCISRQIWFGHEIPVWHKKNNIKLMLVRHGQTDWNKKKLMQGQKDISLNGKGKQDARRLAEKIKNEKFDIIFTSPLKRTSETAQLLNSFNLEIIEDARLKERAYGKFEGQKTNEILKDHPEIETFEVNGCPYWIKVPTAETYEEVKTRVKNFIADLKKKYSGKRVLIVSHGDTLDMFHAVLKNLPDKEAYGHFSLNMHMEKYDLASEEIYCAINAPKGKGWTQDSGTLDTWFSSGMWTFSTLGWPFCAKASGDLARFHPTQVLETGYDILTLWVSRMIIMTLFAINEIPFENVYLHGLVLDKFGKKMSKSKGNGIDPMDMIKLYGADAVRLALLIGTTPGNDVRISPEKIESFRNYATKLWNIYRYSATAYPDIELIDNISKKDIKTLADQWIISRLHQIAAEAADDLENYKFSLAGEKLQKFVWDDFADWYLEISKIEKNKYVLGYVLGYVLKLSHPFMPFITEKIWQDINKGKTANRRILMVEKWPRSDKKFFNKKAEKEFGQLREVITKIRNMRSGYHINPAEFISASINIFTNQEIISRLARLKFTDIKKGVPINIGKIKLVLHISDLIDIGKEKKRQENEVLNLKNLIEKNEAMLKNDNFIQNAPKDVIENNRKKLEEYKIKKEAQIVLLKNLDTFGVI